MISTKTEFLRIKIDFIRKKNFWSKFAPTKFRFIGYHRVSLLFMTIPCETWLLFVTVAFKIKKCIIQIFDFNFSECVDSSILNKIHSIPQIFIKINLEKPVFVIL